MSGVGHVYVMCGVRLRSEIELHLPIETGSGWDVDIRWGEDLHGGDCSERGELVARDEAYGVGWYTVTATPSDHHLVFRDCAEFVISGDVSRITVHRHQPGRSELIPILLAGTVSALLLTLRGTTVLHASAVAIDGVALAIVGQSGRGKSTLAALLCADGAELVTDDVLALTPTSPVRCLGGASELRLREAAANIPFGRPNTVMRVTSDERTAWEPHRYFDGPVDVGVIVFPFPSRIASSVEIRLVSPSEALAGLLACPRINGWRRADEIERDFAVLSAVADTVPGYAAIIPWGPPFDPGIGAHLAELVSPGGTP